MAYITAENGSRQPMFLTITSILLLLSTTTVFLRQVSTKTLIRVSVATADRYLDFGVDTPISSMYVASVTVRLMLLNNMLRWDWTIT